MKSIKKINFRHLLTDILISIITFYLSLYLRVNPEDARQHLPNLHKILFLVILARACFFIYFETYNIIWRYVSAVDAFRLAKAIVGSSIVIIAISYLFQIGLIPRSIYFIDAFLLLSILTAMRLSRRLYHEHKNSVSLKKNGEKTIIYGAGSAGQGVLKRVLADADMKLSVVGFIDDDPKKIGKSILGFKVFGGITDLENIVRDYEIRQIVIGIPSPSAEVLKKTLTACSAVGIKPRILISTGQENLNENLKTELREIELKDLLRRAPHSIDILSTQEMIKGKRVLVTGAGGSIGSEIVRQVLSFSPSRLVAMDHSEFNLYTIDQELKNSEFYDEVMVPALVDMRDRDCLRDIFEKYRPEIVIHAAAYKHVHLVESNPYSAIINNVEGTKNILDNCCEFQITTFILVSSDKAVNPAGIMGATKRICEIMTSIAGEKTGRVYCSVRFGNVLGSSGSLIPLLKKQIEANLPLTITHKDMTRYFMLIDEAVSLVLKAASISKPGDINVLKMGDPVRIVDVAQNLIQLMGRKIEDIQMIFTGLRPGEKMFEELYISGKELNTEHPEILVLPKGDALPSGYSNDEFTACIESMIQFSRKSDRNAIIKLGDLVSNKYLTMAKEIGKK